VVPGVSWTPTASQAIPNEEIAMSTVPRPALRRAAGAIAALLLLGPALGACATTVAGRAQPDAAVGAGPQLPTEPTATPDTTGTPGTTGPSGTDEPTDQPTDGPTDESTSQPTDESTSGPGGSSADRQAIAEIAESFYHGVAVKDGRRVCALLTASAQRSAASDGKDCAGSLQAAELSAAEVAALSKVRVDPDKVEVTGDRGTVPAAATSVNGSSTTETGDMKLLRQGGTWKIDDIT
jgi:hypothetical protein